MKLPIFVLFALATCSVAQIVEQTSPTAAEVARELGITLYKFSAKFAQPVYAVFEVKIRVEGEEDVTIMQQATSDPVKAHEFTFSLKDMNTLSAMLGVAKSSEAKGAIDVSVKHPLVGFTQRLKNPFWQVKPGYSFLNWAQPSSMEKVVLDKMIPLVIQGGPYADLEHQPKNLVEEYNSSPAYIWFGVKFSTLKPVDEEDEKEKK